MAVGDTSLTRVYSSLLTTTLDKVLNSGAIQDNLYKKIPLMKWLTSAGNVKVIDGGERISVPILYDGNGTFTRYADYDTLDTTPLRMAV